MNYSIHTEYSREDAFWVAYVGEERELNAPGTTPADALSNLFEVLEDFKASLMEEYFKQKEETICEDSNTEE